MISQNRNWIDRKEFKTLLAGTKRYKHIKPTLRELHWLPVESRIIFKVLLITFKIIHGLCPAYFVVPPCYIRQQPQLTLSVNVANVFLPTTIPPAAKPALIL